MLEIELKFAVEAFEPIQEKIKAWNARRLLAIEEADHYFNAPDRDFGTTDEAFRLRRIGADNRITYKGPKQGGAAKTRVEVEIPLASGADVAKQFCQLVQHLGYRPTAVVTKRRASFDFQRDGFTLQLCCDEVEALGRFVEIEIVTEPAQRDKAEALLLDTARHLGLGASEPRSYLEMVLAQQNG
ncbi:MAG: class IV adenylate cyclase [Planctomycetes bacterium]|jgi:adenylate cyclase class 2|nr:class IV adenylate cyclase [Planctomycetota bacterium]